MIMNNKEKVIKFLQKHPETDNFEIAVTLDINVNEVERILDNLIQEGVVCLNV